VLSHLRALQLGRRTFQKSLKSPTEGGAARRARFTSLHFTSLHFASLQFTSLHYIQTWLNAGSPGDAALAVLRLSAAQICLLRKFALLLHARPKTKSVRSSILEQEITPSLNLLVRGYLTGIQNSLQAGAINARIGNEVYTKRVKHSTGFSKHLLLLLCIASCFV